MKYTRSAIGLLVLSLLGHGTVLARFLWENHEMISARPRTGLFVMMVLYFIFSSVLMFLIRERSKFRILTGIHALVFLIFHSIYGFVLAYEIILAVLIILPVVTYERFPYNLLLGFGFLLVAAIFRREYLAAFGLGTLPDVLFAQAEFLIIGGVICITGSLMTYYRESIIPLQDEIIRLEEAVSKLATANLSYQNYAQTVQRRTLMQERKRLTRDVHDIAGYTLTNLQMVLRAIKIMAAREPEKIPELVDTAAETTERSREEIREVLRDLRHRDEAAVSGLAAISRYCHSCPGFTLSRCGPISQFAVIRRNRISLRPPSDLCTVGTYYSRPGWSHRGRREIAELRTPPVGWRDRGSSPVSSRASEAPALPRPRASSPELR